MTLVFFFSLFHSLIFCLVCCSKTICQFWAHAIFYLRRVAYQEEKVLWCSASLCVCVCVCVSARASHYCQTPLHGRRLRTPPTDELTTILQLVVQQSHHQRTKICHIPTSWHVEMLGSGIAMWQSCCTTSCRIVLSSSVGNVVQHVRNRCPCSWVWALVSAA